jgi:glycosyltransferase involved in cell wall biosynthesis
MKVLFVLENYLPHIGGVETLFMNLTEELVKKGHKIKIITHRIKGTKKYEKINGVEVHRVNSFHSRILFTFCSIFKSIKLAKKTDIIHTTTFNGAFPAWVASKITKKPSLITVHEVWVDRWKELTNMNTLKSSIFNLLEKLIYSLSFNKYICVSKSTADALSKVKKDKNHKRIATIYNGVDYSHWNPKKYNRQKIRSKLNLKNNFALLCYGRPGVSKGIEYAVKALPLIIKKIPKVKLILIISKDPAYKKRYNYILKLINDLKIKKHVIVHDPVSYKELPNYHMASDCVIIPSLSEGFGYTAAESCAMNIPIIATDNASLPEVVSNKYILIKPKDQKAIAVAIEKIYKKEYKKTRLKKFTWKKAVSRYLTEYKKL